MIWEEDNFTFYVDGKFFCYIPKDRWYSSASDSDTAPFDQDFYLIMNLAIGGNFDGGLAPDGSFNSAEMLVDYVRVYKPEGTIDGPIDLGGNDSPAQPTEPTTPDTDPVDDNTNPDYNPDYSIERIKIVDGNIVTYAKDKQNLISYYRVYDSLAEANSAALNQLPGYLMNNENGNVSLNLGEAPYGKYVVYAFNEAGWDTPRVVAVNNIPNGSDIVTPPTKDEPTKTPEDTTDNTPSTGDTPVFTGESGYVKNSNGTVTIYVKAEDTAFAPMVFTGVNLANPSLPQMGGAVMTKDASGYFTYTTPYTVASGSRLSYLLSYTPLGATGRIDSEIFTVVL